MKKSESDDWCWENIVMPAIGAFYTVVPIILLALLLVGCATPGAGYERLDVWKGRATEAPNTLQCTTRRPHTYCDHYPSGKLCYCIQEGRF